jgi:mannitol/fructose-specific phosphotransferase system IIA component (Ntr-type)
VLIIPQLQSRDVEGAILELCNTFPRIGADWDAEKLRHTALQREQQMSTAMNYGVAFPHVRSNACSRLQFAFGRSPEPFAWGGSQRVSFVFLNAVPAEDAMGYLKLVSAMARLAKDPVLFEALKTATTARGLLELFEKIPLRK